MIEVKNLSYRYPDGTQALHEVSVEFPPEHIFAVLGESGSGKTTLLNCIARFLSTNPGEILLDGRDIAELPEKEFRRSIGVVFQDLNLFPHLTILENMTLAPCKAHGAHPAETHTEAREMLERLGILDLADSYPSQVSGGQAQRAAIGRALMLHPEHLLLDEPTSALDARTTSEFAEWLIELNADASFIIVTHDVLFARRAATHGIYMREGRVERRGRLADMLGAMAEQEEETRSGAPLAQ